MYFFKNRINYEEMYKNEFNKNSDLKNQCLELKETIRQISIENSELRSEVNRYKFYCNELENKLKNNCNLIPKKITPGIKAQVEQMVKSGMTYRDIAKEIDISIKTISRIMNGYYDKK